MRSLLLSASVLLLTAPAFAAGGLQNCHGDPLHPQSLILICDATPPGNTGIVPPSILKKRKEVGDPGMTPRHHHPRPLLDSGRGDGK